MQMKITDPEARLTTEELIAIARVEAGLPYEPPPSKAPEPAPEDPRFAVWLSELEGAQTDLAASLDPAARQAERDEAMAPFAEGGPFFTAPKSAFEAGERRVKAKQDERSGQALYALESNLMQRASEIAAAIQQAEAAPDPAEVATRNHYDPMQSGIFTELRRSRREPFLRACSHTARLRTYQDNPATVEALVDNQIIEELMEAGEIQPTTDVRELAAASELRRRIQAARADRLPKSAKALIELMREARTSASRARQLHRIAPVPPKRK
jgi:hypothetical protein